MSKKEVDTNLELTILMPCLNEAETLEICIQKALNFLKKNKIKGEVLISDNGSTDDSKKIAISNGARVVDTLEKGYGAALINGILEAKGKYIIMGDADDSYDFTNLMPFVEKLREGYDLVMGNRFKGGIEPGAMPPLHKYIGNPVLSFIGRLFYKSKIGDFHCGLRGFNRDSILTLHLNTTGMEFASEMVVKSTLHHLKIVEVPTTLKKDGRSRAPHLRSFRDGWRHLKFLLMYSPKWLFLIPGLILSICGLLGMIILSISSITIGKITFDIHTLLYFAMFLIVGIQVISMALFTKIYGMKTGMLPNNSKFTQQLNQFNFEKGLIIGCIIFVIGIIMSIMAIISWSSSSFGVLNASDIMRLVVPSITLIIVGIQFIFASFFVGILNIKHK